MYQFRYHKLDSDAKLAIIREADNDTHQWEEQSDALEADARNWQSWMFSCEPGNKTRYHAEKVIFNVMWQPWLDPSY